MKKSDIFLILAQNIDCGYSLGGSNEYPQPMFLAKTTKKYHNFSSENYLFTVVKNRSKLHRHVIVMITSQMWHIIHNNEYMETQ